MITNLILTVFINPVLTLLGNLAPLGLLEIPVGIMNGASNLLLPLGFLFPVKALMPILGLSILLEAIRLPWYAIIRAKSFIPTMGA